MDMSSIFFYEPFYQFDRLFDEAAARHHGGQGTQVQRRSSNAPGEGAVGFLKPR
jgi:HSP20 family protein